MNLQDRLAALIAESGKPQKQIASEMGISEGSLTNYLSGREPRLSELRKVAVYFDISPNELLGWGDKGEHLRQTMTIAGVLADAHQGGESAKSEVFNRMATALNELTLALQAVREQAAEAERSLALITNEFRSVNPVTPPSKPVKYPPPRKSPRMLDKGGMPVSSSAVAALKKSVGVGERVVHRELTESEQKPSTPAPSEKKDGPS